MVWENRQHTCSSRSNSRYQRRSQSEMCWAVIWNHDCDHAWETGRVIRCQLEDPCITLVPKHIRKSYCCSAACCTANREEVSESLRGLHDEAVSWISELVFRNEKLTFVDPRRIAHCCMQPNRAAVQRAGKLSVGESPAKDCCVSGGH